MGAEGARSGRPLPLLSPLFPPSLPLPPSPGFPALSGPAATRPNSEQGWRRGAPGSRALAAGGREAPCSAALAGPPWLRRETICFSLSAGCSFAFLQRGVGKAARGPGRHTHPCAPLSVWLASPVLALPRSVLSRQTSPRRSRGPCSHVSLSHWQETLRKQGRGQRPPVPRAGPSRPLFSKESPGCPAPTPASTGALRAGLSWSEGSRTCLGVRPGEGRGSLRTGWQDSPLVFSKVQSLSLIFWIPNPGICRPPGTLALQSSFRGNLPEHHLPPTQPSPCIPRPVSQNSLRSR